MPRHVERNAIETYVRERLRDECLPVRGRQAEIARATKISSAHIANVVNGRAGVGSDFAHAMADYWSMTYAELERVATAGKPLAPRPTGEPVVEYDAGEGPQARAPKLKYLPGWVEAEAAARRRYRHIPDEAFVRARETMTYRPPRLIDVNFVLGMAMTWANAMAGEGDETDELRAELARGGGDAQTDRRATRRRR